MPITREDLVHLSRACFHAPSHMCSQVLHAAAAAAAGDVKLLETNERGQFKLSRRAVLLDEGGEKVRAELAQAKAPADGDGGGWNRDDEPPSRGRPPPKARRGRSRLRE